MIKNKQQDKKRSGGITNKVKNITKDKESDWLQ